LLRRLRVLSGGKYPDCREASADLLAAKLTAATTVAEEWKAAHSMSPPPRAGDCWNSVRDLPEGDWAAQYLQMGLRCGRARGGHPVKIERIGRHKIGEMKNDPNAEIRLKTFYFSLLEDLYRSLNEQSADAGTLLRMYEIFDLEGISVRQAVSPLVLGFARSTLTVVARVYCGTTQRAVVLNTPRALKGLLNGVIQAMPARVKQRVLVLGANYHDALADDLDSEALAFLSADGATLTAHRAPKQLLGAVTAVTPGRVGLSKSPPAQAGPGLAATATATAEPAALQGRWRWWRCFARPTRAPQR